ncbi:MAG TPA: clostripain-related cysteine peptidase [Chitinophaga sp.]
MKNNGKKKWTVIYLIRSVERINAHHIKKMFDQILEDEIPDDVSVIICLNSFISAITTLDIAYTPPAVFGPDDTTTCFYSVVPATAPAENKKSKMKLLVEERTFRIKEPADVSRYFKEKVLAYHAADKYLLFTWDHGAAFGVFVDGPMPRVVNASLDNDIFIDHKFRDKIKKDQLGEAAFLQSDVKTALQELTTTEFDMLSMDELRDAIECAFPEKKVDVLIMLNCWMQFFDTGLTLYRHVDYLVAAETTMAFSGYNYRAIFRLLYSRPDISPQSLADFAVTSFKEKAAADPQTPERDTALFANALAYYPRLAELIDDISLALIPLLKTDFAAFKRIMERCDTVELKYNLVDLSYFLYHVKKELRQRLHPDIIDKINAISRIRPQMIINRYVGPGIVNSTTFPKKNPLGFSVCFPRDIFEVRSPFYKIYILQNSEFANVFSKNYSWDDFVAAYVKRSQLPVIHS